MKTIYSFLIMICFLFSYLALAEVQIVKGVAYQLPVSNSVVSNSIACFLVLREGNFANFSLKVLQKGKVNVEDFVESLEIKGGELFIRNHILAYLSDLKNNDEVMLYGAYLPAEEKFEAYLFSLSQEEEAGLRLQVRRGTHNTEQSAGIIFDQRTGKVGKVEVQDNQFSYGCQF